MEAGVLLFWIAVAIGAIVAAQKIAKGKGRENGWVWGFFLGWIGVLVCALRQPVKSQEEQDLEELELQVRRSELEKRRAELEVRKAQLQGGDV
jgi:hypothetical protein